MALIWLKNRTISQLLAIFIAGIFLAITIFYVYPSLVQWNNANNELNQAREYNLSLSNTINILTGEEQYNLTWQIDLTINQPHNTLTIGDRVDISGIAYAETPPNFKIIDLSVWFQNSQPHNITSDENGMLDYNGSTIHLFADPNSNKLVGNASIKWELEGSYSPIGQMLFENGTGKYNQYLGSSPDMTITVYPKSEYAQIVNSNVTMVLTGAVYLLTLVGIGDLLIHLWDRGKCYKDNQSDSKSCNNTSQPENYLANKQKRRENDNGNSEIEQKENKKV